ncbi:CapA family protein [Dactylosporangium sp. AC04546]|uniref:CapA family protein n=1 Tax=Dactylosporangium sp. AC04546 TaxID=2862460 RepID=UPI001EE04E68|nr:CapA family protein [Dactylosporangium sp. AC04546]WVK82021.1 CapA family protein [Dactylosporangium sp. AC04546]
MRLGVLVFAVVLAGCSSTAAPSAAPPPSSAGAAASPSGSPSPSAPVDLRLVFAGDVHFMDRTAVLLKHPSTAFGPIAPTLADADLTIVNLETAITSRGTAEPKTYHFRTTPVAIDALKAAGVDAVSIANNHTLDYGRVGLLDTLDALGAASYPAFGAGRNVDAAYAPWLTTVRGVRIAVLGFSQVGELASSWAPGADKPGIAMAFDTDRAVAAVTAARRQADLVIVFNHWGDEGNSCANSAQKTFAGKLAAAGADVIVGAHAHTLQGSGWLGQTFVAYGMGNFLWYGPSKSTETGVLRLTVRGRSVTSSEFLPAVVSDTGQPKLLTGAAATRLSDRYAGLRRCAGLSGPP